MIFVEVFGEGVDIPQVTIKDVATLFVVLSDGFMEVTDREYFTEY